MTKRKKALLIFAAFLSLAGGSALAAPPSTVPGPNQNPGPPVLPAVFACRNTVCGIEVVTDRKSVDNGRHAGMYSLYAEALCPRGKHAIGGGATYGGNFNQIAGTSNAPLFETDGDGNVLDPLPIGWQADSIRLNDEPLNAGWDVIVWAICATVQ